MARNRKEQISKPFLHVSLTFHVSALAHQVDDECFIGTVHLCCAALDAFEGLPETLAAAEETVANPGNPSNLFVLHIFVHCKCMFDGPGVQ